MALISNFYKIKKLSKIKLHDTVGLEDRETKRKQIPWRSLLAEDDVKGLQNKYHGILPEKGIPLSLANTFARLTEVRDELKLKESLAMSLACDCTRRYQSIRFESRLSSSYFACPAVPDQK